MGYRTLTPANDPERGVILSFGSNLNELCKGVWHGHNITPRRWRPVDSLIQYRGGDQGRGQGF
jgi:hypothetical protein